MPYSFESTTPKQEAILTEWLDHLVTALELKRYGEVKLHIRIADGWHEGVNAAMLPFKCNGVIMIELNRKKLAKALPGLAHEMVHVQQVLRGDQIVNPVDGRSFWKGTPYNSFAVNHHASENVDFYKSLPWEKEAHERMWPLAEMVAKRSSAWRL